MRYDIQPALQSASLLVCAQSLGWRVWRPARNWMTDICML
jgi:hypothetical protein